MTRNTRPEEHRSFLKMKVLTGGGHQQSHQTENVWHELKEFVRREVKPTCQAELVRGIKQFWEDHVDVAKCQRYILHLRKVLPRVIEKEGGPTGY